MAENELIPKDVAEAQESVAKPSKKGKLGSRIPRNVAVRLAGAAAAVVTGVAGLPGVDTTGPSLASAQAKEPPRPTQTLPPRETPRPPATRTAVPTVPPSPTTNPDVITVHRDVYNQSIENSVEGRWRVKLAEEAKKPTPPPVIKYVQAEASGGGGGLGLLDLPVKALVGVVALLFGIANSKKVEKGANRVMGRLRIPRRGATPPDGTPPAAPPAH